jgi:hypothetical protein
VGETGGVVEMDSDEKFLADFAEGQRWEWLGTRILLEEEYDVRMIPSRLRPDSSDRRRYGDKGDVEVRKIVSIKHRPDLLFTCAEDYREYYKTVTIDEVRIISKVNIWEIEEIMIFNGPGTHVCRVPVDKWNLNKKGFPKNWGTEDRYDPAKDKMRKFKVIDPELCVFERVSENLRQEMFRVFNIDSEET